MTTATYVRTEPLQLGDLSPYPGNAKRGDVGAILESLCRNGQYRSLIVREAPPGEYTVLAGNHTLQALAAHGPGPCGLTVKVDGEERPCAVCRGEEWEPQARCEIVHCDVDTARRVNLVDNRTAELGDWDEEALAELLGQLGDDMGGTGYDTGDLEDLLTALEDATDAPDDEDEDQEQPGGPGAGDGDRPASPGPNADGTSTLPPGQVQMVLTYTVADRDEAARLISSAREQAYEAAGAPEVILNALRGLAAILRHREHPDRAVTVAQLLRAAGITTE
ncbi:ParB/Srx family N-terminal domain-containing protein [[Kitasatospora] papulosa]|uniref:ParB/Srx family N-terminal domain-containing protein n=1 Tax=[Kitasatospora] papulosa TaxID=1464011 RepID=UPI00367D9DB8